MTDIQDIDVFFRSINQFVAREVLPQTRVWESAGTFPEGIWTRLGELGLFRVLWPKGQGGLDLSCAQFCEVVRMLAHGDPALAMSVSALNALAVGHLRKFGSEEQIAKYAPGILTGEIKLAWALTEPEAGSDAKRIKTVGKPIPDRPGFFALSGRKMFITNAGLADLIVLIARTPDEEISAFLVETNQPGFVIEKRLETVGVCASNTSQFMLKDAAAWHTPCRFDEAISLLYRGRLGIAAMALGISEKAYQLALDYSKHREQFNRRLADMQSVQNMLADSALEIEASRLLIENCAKRFDEGLPIVKESAFAKLFASETSNRVTNRAIQIHGGRGMTRDYLVEKLWRDAKLTEIGEGCSEILRLVIAKAILK